MGAAPGLVADNTAAALTAQLGEVWDSLSSLGRSLSDEEWRSPTPCPGWTVASQFAHVIGTESMLLGRANPEVDPGHPDHVRNDIGGFNEVWVASLAGEPRLTVLDGFDEVMGARREALASMGEEQFSEPSWTPVGKADYRRFMQIRVFDCWVHEQDVRDGTGRAGHESGAVAEQAVDEIVRALGYIFGKKAGAPDGSSMTVQLTGPVERTVNVAVIDGRARTVDALADPAARLALSSSAFTRLACGRISPDEVLGGGLGGVTIVGDEPLAVALITNLAFTI
jgi:uncharacterized protein (TIGR03083 family)